MLASLNVSAKRELAELLEERHRRECRRSFLAFCEEALEPFGQTPAAHHRLLIKELQAVADGLVDRLMVLMPPGSAKTTYGSYLFPAWLMARGGTQVLGTSHSIARAVYVSRRVQRIIKANEATLRFRLANDAVEQWATTNGGEYTAAGVGKGIAGTRARYGLIDDPVRTRQAADSEVTQETIWDWYWGDFLTRLGPGAAQVIMMTRWAEGDLGGRLEEAEGKDWRIVRVKAIAEADDPLGRKPGEYLWDDDGFGYGDKLRANFISYSNAGKSRDWSALFQQVPVPDTGDYFHKDWLRSVPTLPPRESLRIFGGSDYAVTDNGGDFTVHAVLGIDSDDRLYVCDLWRGQTSSDVWVEAFCDLVIMWHPMGWAEELGQIKSGIGPWLDRRSRERKAYVAREAFPTRGDKSVRAQSIRGRAALSGLYIPADAPWRAALEAELLSFPAGKHDDQVDALGLVGQLLDMMIAPPKPREAPPREDSWERAFNRDDEEGADDFKTV